MVQRIVVSVLKIGLILNRNRQVRKERNSVCVDGTRIATRYHGLSHLARVTIHDRWVDRRRSARLVDFRGARRRPARRAEDATRKGLFFNVGSTSSFVNTGWTGDKLMTASPFFEHGLHSTEWRRQTHRAPALKTAPRAQPPRGPHLPLGTLRPLATAPRLMALPLLALSSPGSV